MISTVTSLEPMLDQVLGHENKCQDCQKQVMAHANPLCCRCRYGHRAADHFRFEIPVLDSYVYIMRHARR